MNCTKKYSFRDFSFGLIIRVLITIIIISTLSVMGCTEKETEGRKVIHFVTWKFNIPEVWDDVIKNRGENISLALRDTGIHFFHNGERVSPP